MIIYFAVATMVCALLLVGAHVGPLELRRHDRVLAADLSGSGPVPTPSGVLASRQRRPGIFFNVFHAFALLVLVAFCGLRYRVGTDYDTYRLIFQRISTDDWGSVLHSSTQETGFTILQLFIKTFTDEPAALFLVSSFLTVVPVWFAIRRALGEQVVLAWALWIGMAFYLSSFNALRQGIAVSFILLAATYLPKSRAKFIAFTAIASLFHVTAVLAAVVIYLSKRWKPSVKRVAMVLSGSAVFALVGLAGLAPIVGVLNARYTNYVTEGAETGLGAWLQIAAYSAVLLWALFIGNDRNDHEQQRYVTWAILAIGLMLIGTQAVILFRMSAYFKVFVILVVPMCIAKSRAPVTHATGMLLTTAVYCAAHIAFYDDLLPYQSIF